MPNPLTEAELGAFHFYDTPMRGRPGLPPNLQTRFYLVTPHAGAEYRATAVPVDGDTPREPTDDETANYLRGGYTLSWITTES